MWCSGDLVVGEANSGLKGFRFESTSAPQVLELPPAGLVMSSKHILLCVVSQWKVSQFVSAQFCHFNLDFSQRPVTSDL